MSSHPKRLKRSESFVGLHFDFHARTDCTQVGKTVTLDMLKNMLALTKPDYVQCDCKGHPGYASYPTKVGTPAPGFTQDPLKLWRQATEEAGVSLYMHYSGVIDEKVASDHPDWASLDQDGKPHKNGSTSVFGPYVDEILIPMFRELTDVYHVDGVWIDGECWGLTMDYSEHALKAWQKSTGQKTFPTDKDDPDWFACQQFHRQGFRDYVAHYISELRKTNPDFEIASNWAFSGHMPEKATLDVDFISGDVTPTNGFNRACLEARIMEGQPRPWDLMAWAFNGRWAKGDSSTKSVIQLCQEAAAVLAMGGGFQAYFTQKRDGSIYEWQMQVAKGMIDFCRQRQASCHRATPIPQVGLILSSETYYRQPDALFCPWGGFFEPMEGHLRNILDNQYAVQIPLPWQLEEDIERFPLLVYGEWKHISLEMKTRLVEYVHKGGKLLLIGPNSVAHFAEELGVTADRVEDQTRYVQTQAGIMGNFQTPVMDVTVVKDDVEVTHWFYPRNEPLEAQTPACTIRPMGKGLIAAIHMDLGKRYATARTTAARDVMGDMLKRLFLDPMVKVQGSHHVDVAVNQQGDELMINLINSTGNHADQNCYTFDELPPLGPLVIDVTLDKAPQQVRLQPGDREIDDVSFEAGKLHVVIPRLELHEIIQITP
ncbi:MAG: hypothetical protein CMJ19_07305 [Phycisphaeraceae bacterium]|nr:hypothetical protein [Phycisphaeraceae bacterium]